MKTAVGYERYSNLSQSEMSITVQQEAIDYYCRNNGITLIRHYSDYAISGRSTEHRVEFLMNSITKRVIHKEIDFNDFNFRRCLEWKKSYIKM